MSECIKRVLVVGGGAAGMMAALAAAEQGAEVIILEKNEKLGKKLFITGKGRCNLTNACDFDTFLCNIVSNPRFLYSAYSACSNWDVYARVEAAGCPLKIERGERVFPVSDHSSDVIHAFQKMLEKAGVSVHLFTEVRSIRMRNTDDTHKPAVQVEAFQTKTKKSMHFLADAVVICTGGKSYAATGSTGDGYRFARSFDLAVTKPVPALVPLTVEKPDCAPLSGVSLKNIAVQLYPMEEQENGNFLVGEKPVYEAFGEMLFTHTGVSGPVILSASSVIAKALAAGNHFQLSIDLKPALSMEKLDERLLRDFANAQNKNMENALEKLLLSALRPYVLSQAGILPQKKVHDISKAERNALLHAIKGLQFEVNGTRGFPEAIITQGGISVRELNPKTMEVKKIPGLYFAGEVLDIDAFTGGFNLQLAFSSGYAAGLAAGAPSEEAKRG